jgi:hypothetical protein
MFSPMLLSRPQVPVNTSPSKSWEAVPRPVGLAVPVARPLAARPEERLAALA